MAYQLLSASDLERKVGRHILAFRRAHTCMMFSDLAKALPDYTWHRLFGALGRLCNQHRADLLAHQRGYEVIFLDGTSRNESVSPPLHQSDQGDHDEEMHV